VNAARTGTATPRPRIVVASRLFHPEIGAAAFRLRALAVALHEAGADVRVLTTRPPRGQAARADPSGIRVSRFPVLRDAGGHVRGYLQYASFDLPLVFRLLAARPRVIVADPPPTTGVVAAVAAAILRRPLVYYAADVWSDAALATGAPGFVIRLLRALERFSLRRAALVLAVSPEVARRVEELSGRTADEIGNGIDTAVFTREGDDHRDRKPHFVYAGTVSEWQGVDVFVRAAHRLRASHPKVRLHIFGQGSALPALRDLAAELDDEIVTFHGLVEPEAVASWLRSSVAALVSIVPDRGYDFARPTKVYAAAACGTPVIFAGTGAGAALVESEDLGWAIPHDDRDVEAAMRAALTAAAADETASKRDARAGWATAEVSLEAVGARAARHILAVTGRGRAGR
jgi:glycosyltransferase involved in cell wall biosynthesis